MGGALTHGRHLLGYCYLNLGDSERALREFKKCVKEDFQYLMIYKYKLFLEKIGK